MNQVPSYHDGETKLVALLGHPVRHTASPVFQNAALQMLGINAVYVPFDVPPENLASAFNGLRSLGAIGTNVTVPHKEAVYELCDECSPEAHVMKAVNTVKFEGNRALGYNTDAYGIATALAEEGMRFHKARVVVLGAGGAAKAIVAQAMLDGASELFVINRTVERAEDLVLQIIKNCRTLQPSKKTNPLPICQALGYDEIRDALREADILINATSVGLRIDDSLLFNPTYISPGTFVYDTIYNPPQTKLLIEAKKSGCAKTANGLTMLLHQGARAFELWWNRPAPVELMRNKLTEPSFIRSPSSQKLV